MSNEKIFTREDAKRLASECEHIAIPDGYTQIEEGAFHLRFRNEVKDPKSITIPASVTVIASAEFNGRQLTRIEVAAGNPAYTSLDGVLFSKDMTMLLAYPPGRTGAQYTVPDEVSVIAAYAFSHCKLLKEVILPDGLIEIGYVAFWECEHLSRVNIPASLVKIGRNAFFGCRGLLDISVDEQNTAYCDVDGVLFTKDMSAIIQYTPAVTRETYTVPDGVVYIAICAFREAEHLTCVTLPESVTSIGKGGFEDCWRLTEINLPEGLRIIREFAFRCCDLTDVTIPDGVETIEYDAYGCLDGSLKRIYIPPSVTSIGYSPTFKLHERAFRNVFDDMTICCHEGSEAHRYAQEHNIKFELVEEV